MCGALAAFLYSRPTKIWGRVIATIIDIVTRDISAEQPFGRSLTGEALFDTLKQEMGKSGGIDLALIEQSAIEILANQSKDLRAVAWLAFALLRQERWEEFADLFEGVAKLAAKDFASLYPERPRAKQLALQWLSEQRFVDTISLTSPHDSDRDHIARLHTSLSHLKPALDQAFPDESPFPAALHAKSAEWLAASQRSAPGTGVSSGSVGGAAAAPAARTPSQNLVAIRTMALEIIEADVSSAAAHRILRASRWDVLGRIPPAPEGRTQFESPPSQLRDHLAALESDAKWSALLLAASRAFATGGNHLWLDIQRMACIAARSLGAEFELVARGIGSQTAEFVQRLAGVESLCFVDGVSCCDKRTREWLGGLGRPTGELTAESDKAGGSGNAGVAPELAAAQLASQGKLDEALGLLGQARAGAITGHDGFVNALLVARLLSARGKPHQALPILASLLQAVDTHGLERWEPSLAAQAIVLYIETCGAVAVMQASRKGELLSTRSELLVRLARIDPVRAAQMV